MDERVLMSLRGMAWERAKGELQAMLATYWPQWNARNQNESGFDKANKLVTEFIKKFEDSCL